MLSSVRVLMAVPQYPYPVVGGLERQSHELAKALIGLGVEVQAVSGTIGPGKPSEEWVDGVFVQRISWSPNKAVRAIVSPLALARVIFRRRKSYDVIHLHQFSWFAISVIGLARLLGKPVLTKLPNVAAHGLPGLAASRFGAFKVAIFRQSDAVVAMSRQSLRELAAIGFPASRVLATPNGISMSVALAPQARTSTGTALCRVVFVGRLSAEKKLDDLLHTWRRVVTVAARTAMLELWGTGPLDASLRQLTASLGLEDSVVFRGHVDSVRDRLGTMDMLCLPSSLEGNSNAILEAMAAGLPVVSTRVGGTPMLVGAVGAPYLVDPGDREGLGAHLLELIGDEKLRRRVGDAMRQRIQDHFEIGRVAATYAEAYRLLATGNRDRLGEIGDPLIAE